MAAESTIPADGDSGSVVRPLVRIRDAGLILGLTLLVALVLKIFVVEAILVPSRSMEGAVLPGDYVFVDKLIYGARAPRFLSSSPTSFARLPRLRSVARGDVIVFELPADARGPTADGPVHFVKRCVGLPGDVVAMRDGILAVNGERMTIPSMHTDGMTNCSFGPFLVPRSGRAVRLSEGTIRMLAPVIRREGHSIAALPDGRYLVDGVAATTYAVKDNYLFVLGDNLSDSYDSRSWGFLPEDNVVGRAMMVYWSVDESGHPRWERLATIIR